MGIWIALLVMTAIAALIVLVPMLRARQMDLAESPRDITVYADQLAELDRDAERGLIGATESAAARTEIARRILRADGDAVRAPVRAGKLKRAVAAGMVVIGLPTIAIGLYTQVGAPFLPDEPLAERTSQPLNALSADALIARLDAQLAANPTDIKGWELGAPIYMRMGRFPDAVTAYQTAIRLGGPDARRLTGLGEALTASAQGVVTSEARASFDAAVALDPNLPLPKMYLALSLSQDGKLADSRDAWKRVIAMAKGEEPWLPSARKELAAVEAEITRASGATPPAGVPPVPGAGQVPPAMIESMVARLSQRLETQGGTAEEWGRLMKSYLVLGRSVEAKAAYDKARVALASDTVATASLSAIASDLGLQP